MAADEELVARAKAVWEESEAAMEKSMGVGENLVLAISVMMAILLVLCLVVAVWLCVKSQQKEVSTFAQITGAQKAEQEEMERRNILAEVYGHEASGADAFENGLGDLELAGADLEKARQAKLQHDAGHEEKKKEKSTDERPHRVLKLATFVTLWYFFNVQYNVQNKRLLQVFPAPGFVALVQIWVGVPLSIALWGTRILRLPTNLFLQPKNLQPLLLPAVCFTAGQVATVASLSASSVAFVHVIKALEPAVNAAATALCLGRIFHPLVYLTLVPLFTGVALVTISDASFSTYGLLTAMASNVAFASRNVLSSKTGSIEGLGDHMIEKKSNQLAILTCMSSLLCLVSNVFLPGGLFEVSKVYNESMQNGLSHNRLFVLLLTSGFHFFMYQLSSFWVLSQAEPITHSVLNTVKRVVVILASVLILHSPMNARGFVGTMVALASVLLYSLTKTKLSQKGKEGSAG
mmetsp:Transcript_1122/g.2390  ORF Transcript_1122/g.2390 Transcript_1122/m.2390 type:complete len:463 (+) Transcript_1122:168-1556(+)|eukprot:CAMPEP_0206422658 /NCGR_PEP_ID=MMETSP0324_2-20121206/2220_1 /ASSEMBLY_ACC=CAM_ASM_000836 /TAXON_ID=2866 /ORGANISM="Crypthecodinium cohnii, Strain Seligo" /LENGTH=462 /DNA_ID=CAMNT_0053887077 /DNA_START=104 /DNA_END=1492 /DNA_ORIENTATION=-